MRTKTSSSSPALRLGFVPLVDCAPLVMAQELGLFRKYGLRVALHREVGWVTIRDKIIYKELEAAHAPAGLVVAASLGLGCVAAPCLTGLVLNLHGNAITLSQRLWREGVRDGASLARHVREAVEPLTFGVVHSFSSHNLLLRHWLRAHCIDPDHDVRIVMVPPPQMTGNLRAGHLDGYCVGEPWNSLAVLSRTGWVAATSSELAPRHPEKVLMVRQEWAEQHSQDHLALVAALLESCRFCDAPENRERIMETLAQPEYVGAPIQALRMNLGGTFDFGHGRIDKLTDFHIFFREEANAPDREKALWVLRNLSAHGLLPTPAKDHEAQAGEWFRMDIYRQAQQLPPPSSPIERNSRESDALDSLHCTNSAGEHLRSKNPSSI